MLSIFFEKLKSTVCPGIKAFTFQHFCFRNLTLPKERLCDNDGDKSIINKNIYPAMESACIRPCTQVLCLEKEDNSHKICQVTYPPSVVSYKNRWVENDFVCGGKGYSVLQIVFDHNVLFEKVKQVIAIVVTLLILGDLCS